MNGFLNILKDKGFTSHDVVALVRRYLPKVRVGHLGTLDPLAVGVLPIAVGTYRRLAEYLLAKDKDYLAEFTMGVSTDSGDIDGKILELRDASYLSPTRVQEEALSLTGTLTQIPPSYSAVRVHGRRLYELAREGIALKAPPREVFVSKFELVGWRNGIHPKALFSLTVSSGTYVRSLASSLGEKLSCGATVSYLLRSRVGNFCLRDSIPLGQFRRYGRQGNLESLWSDPLDMLKDFPIVRLKRESLNKVIHGVQLGTEDFLSESSSLVQRDSPTIAVLENDTIGGVSKVVAVLRMNNGKVKYDKVLVH
jgi:tRNA pseudouridine55 synthase